MPLPNPESIILLTIILLVTAGVIAAAVWMVLFRCAHKREMFDRYPDGRAALRCQDCLRMRPNILVSAPQYRRTQAGGPINRPETGIERTWAVIDEPITDEELFDLAGSRR